MKLKHPSPLKGMEKLGPGQYEYKGRVITASDAYKGHWDFVRVREDGRQIRDTWEGLSMVKYLIDNEKGN